MGIRGLWSFIEHHNLGEAVDANGRGGDGALALIIDGSSLYHHLTAKADSGWVLGGDYAGFEAAARAFLGDIVRRGFHVALFLDGGRLESKYLTVKRRMHDHYEDAERINRNLHAGRGALNGVQSGGAAPLMTKESLMAVAREWPPEQLSVHVSPLEADDQCWHHAVVLGDRCLGVITNDTDFALLDAGMIPASSIEMRSGSRIRFRRVARKHVAHAMAIPPRLVPVVAVLVGNDHFEAKTALGAFHRHVRQQFGSHGRARGLVSSMGRFVAHHQDEAIGAALEVSGVSDRGDVLLRFSRQILKYDSSTSSFPDEDSAREIDALGGPDRYRALYDDGRIPSDLLQVRARGVYWWRPLVEDMGHESVYRISAPLRAVLFTLLTAGTDPPVPRDTVSEFVRVGLAMSSERLPLDNTVLDDPDAAILALAGLSPADPIPDGARVEAIALTFVAQASALLLEPHELRALSQMIAALRARRPAAAAAAAAPPRRHNDVDIRASRRSLRVAAAYQSTIWTMISIESVRGRPAPYPSELFDGHLFHELLTALDAAVDGPVATAALEPLPPLAAALFDLASPRLVPLRKKRRRPRPAPPAMARPLEKPAWSLFGLLGETSA